MPSRAPREGLCRAVRHRVRAAVVDRERRRDPRPAVRRLRSVSPRRGAPTRDPTSSSGFEDFEPKIKINLTRSAKRSPRAASILERVGNMDADVAHAALTALHGVGPWTADIYLLFCLGHADAFPAGDLVMP